MKSLDYFKRLFGSKQTHQSQSAQTEQSKADFCDHIIPQQQAYDALNLHNQSGALLPLPPVPVADADAASDVNSKTQFQSMTSRNGSSSNSRSMSNTVITDSNSDNKLFYKSQNAINSTNSTTTPITNNTATTTKSSHFSLSKIQNFKTSAKLFHQANSKILIDDVVVDDVNKSESNQNHRKSTSLSTNALPDSVNPNSTQHQPPHQHQQQQQQQNRVVLEKKTPQKSTFTNTSIPIETLANQVIKDGGDGLVARQNRSLNPVSQYRVLNQQQQQQLLQPQPQPQLQSQPQSQQQPLLPNQSPLIPMLLQTSTSSMSTAISTPNLMMMPIPPLYTRSSILTGESPASSLSGAGPFTPSTLSDDHHSLLPQSISLARLNNSQQSNSQQVQNNVKKKVSFSITDQQQMASTLKQSEEQKRAWEMHCQATIIANQTFIQTIQQMQNQWVESQSVVNGGSVYGGGSVVNAPIFTPGQQQQQQRLLQQQQQQQYMRFMQQQQQYLNGHNIAASELGFPASGSQKRLLHQRSAVNLRSRASIISLPSSNLHETSFALGRGRNTVGVGFSSQPATPSRSRARISTQPSLASLNGASPLAIGAAPQQPLSTLRSNTAPSSALALQRPQQQIPQHAQSSPIIPTLSKQESGSPSVFTRKRFQSSPRPSVDYSHSRMSSYN